MNRFLGRVLTVGVVAIASPVLAPAGCATNDQSIYIRLNLAPPQNRQNGECIYQPDPTANFEGEGTLDVLARDSYFANLLVGSQMLARGDQPNTRAEPNRVHLNGAIVTVTELDGSEIGSFTSTGTGFIDPQSANTASFGILGVNIIDAATSQKIAGGLRDPRDPTSTLPFSKRVLANVKAFGKTLGGVDLESGEFQYPVVVCKGCLVTFVGGDDPATPGRDCNLALSTTGASAGTQTVLPCNAGQDEITPCQACNDVAHPFCQGK